MQRLSAILLTLAGVLPAAATAATAATSEPPSLPPDRVFKGEEEFRKIVAKARKNEWVKLPVGERIIRFAKEMHGTPYVGYTLEIDDRVEAPSVNLLGLDCWTFFEIALGLARMIETPRDNYRPEDLLAQIRFTRYRAGQCSGDYLDRIHYLAEWFFENEARGVARDITRELGGVRFRKECREMTVLWKSYRYLRENPELRPRMAKHETRISKLPVYHIPKSKVPAIEKKLRNGDIVGIATNGDGSFCSHVGLAYRDSEGVLRLMHASSHQKYRRVVIDSRLSTYLNRFRSHAGIIVARPNPVSVSLRDAPAYKENLRRLTGGG